MVELFLVQPKMTASNPFEGKANRVSLLNVHIWGVNGLYHSLLFISMENGNRVRRIYNNRVKESLSSKGQRALIPASAPASYPEVLGTVTPLQLGGCPQSS